MEAAERELQVRRFVDEVWNGRNYAAAADLYSEKYSNPFGVRPEARIEPIRRYREAFPDLYLDIEDLIVAGDTVVLRVAFRGTDTGGYVGRAPTGRAVNHTRPWAIWCVRALTTSRRRIVRSGAPIVQTARRILVKSQRS